LTGAGLLTGAATLAGASLLAGAALLAGVSLLTAAGIVGAFTLRCALAMANTPSTTTVTNTEIRITRRFMASSSW
jgi:hypothetical protein